MALVTGLDADGIIELLDLKPHPEGGHFAETFRDPAGGTRAHSTAIYYLLREGERSHWHRVDAAEIWHWYAGGPLALSFYEEGRNPETRLLGQNLDAGERPQLVVPSGVWQAAAPVGLWTLVGCTVAPGFEFGGFEMAEPDWHPGS
ncbi:cupin domain-containing protein [Parvibaculum sp.]|uniref:cupin domain-containing protein n=1 Tax=Parvibaculum sp. TaxID=2024848 RepID=UPI002730D269|nr:cupin domain-containing protein [Parvibaculum sp.]MDP1625783.1 cupin domain-containing protein [Parvibaculum sp.]MDP2149146.1 cupin domain-containing protein [Parvibaculum sp.]MDP3329807.1 cupin domain-containing protein [Parvibaculum sp.]